MTEKSLTLITQPTEEPVSLAEAKVHLRLDTGETSPITTHPDDSLISALIKAARRWAEAFQNRSHLTQTWKLSLEAFPAERFISLPRPPLQFVASLTYKDSAETMQVVSFVDPSGGISFETDDYIIDINKEPGRLCLKNGKSWPTAIAEAQSVVIEYTAGYESPDDVPAEVKAAILLKLSNLYENRGDAGAEVRSDEAARGLLDHDREVPI